jgi:hypothetical protein
LCKKKESLYEGLIGEFRESMKETEFKNLVLEKKVGGLEGRWRELVEAVRRNASAEDIWGVVMGFEG